MRWHDSSAGLRVLAALGVGALVFLLPLAGAWLARREIQGLFEFPPPLRIPSGYLRFSWAAVVAVLAGLLAIGLPWVRLPRSSSNGTGRLENEAARGISFPWWGWLAAGWTVAWWVLAWTRFDWFSAFQKFTFFPLWPGFIVFLNALIQLRVGSCRMLRDPGRWFALFGVSAACWWGFEWLNRFVQNWHYLNVQDFSAAAYAFHATVCFATVLPAVSAIAELLGTIPAWRGRMAAGPRWSWLAHRGTAVVLAFGGVIALVATGFWPTWVYPALWVAPFSLVLSIELFSGDDGLACDVAAGDWSAAGSWMIASLVCGFFWELWNWQSLAKWIYTVPGVERWFIFEMPLLGYAGYLPFGLECYFATRVVGRFRP